MGQVKFTISLVMIALFSMALIGFAINFGIDNNTNVNLGQDSDFGSLNSSLNNKTAQFYLDSNTSANAILQSTVSSQTESTEGGTGFKATVSNLISSAYSSLNTAGSKIFGGQFDIFFNSLVALLLFIAFLYAWKTWAGRNPN